MPPTARSLVTACACMLLVAASAASLAFAKGHGGGAGHAGYATARTTAASKPTKANALKAPKPSKPGKSTPPGHATAPVRRTTTPKRATTPAPTLPRLHSAPGPTAPTASPAKQPQTTAGAPPAATARNRMPVERRPATSHHAGPARAVHRERARLPRKRAVDRGATPSVTPPPARPRASNDRPGGAVGSIVYSVPAAVNLALTAVGLVAVLLALFLLVGRRQLLVARSRASSDPLTGLPNHRAVYERLDRAITAAVGAGEPFAAVMIDLDAFKRINDSYGHLCGDEVLRAVAKRLRHDLRAQDFVGRYGGEEFIAVLPATSREGAVALVDRLRRRIWEVEIDGVRELITTSMGVAAFPTDGRTPTELVAAADRALYAAKERGRNRVEAAGEAVDGAEPLGRRHAGAPRALDGRQAIASVPA